MQVSSKLSKAFGLAGVLISVGTWSVAGSALAQQDSGCKAPQEQQQSKQDNTKSATHSADDSSKLADCGGVLQPPTTGDTGMVTPAPSVGKTPVIPPSDVPKNQNGNQPQSK